MKRISRILAVGLVIGLASSSLACRKSSDFTFAFLTDIHVQPEKRATEGYRKAIEKVNALKPDFVITGGDLVMDVLGQNFKRADMLYNLYLETTKRFAMPVYNTIGNHEVFGLYSGSGVSPDHPEFAEKMYERRIGKKTYSFDHKGWHFMILDSIGRGSGQDYRGWIDASQMQWIEQDLASVSKKTPIVISVHIPFITAVTQLRRGSLESNNPGIVIVNAKQVLELYREHNLRLVLQGHLHVLEEIRYRTIRFLIGGAVSARWWDGPNNGMEEGFVLIRIKGDEISWEYIDFGWEVE